MTTKTAALLLLPNLLGEHKHHAPFLPASVDKAVAELDGLIAESPGAGRRFLKRFMDPKAADAIPIALCNEHTKAEDVEFLLEPLIEGQIWGLVSDAGLPCLADPGSALVRRARERGVRIKTFVGPSAITMALMLSGMSGQAFAFHGYLPRDPQQRQNRIRELELRAEKEEATQIFMEAPYRNNETLEALLSTLKPGTQFCAAWNLTMPDQGLLSQSVEIWKKSPAPNLDKKPTVFLISKR